MAQTTKSIICDGSGDYVAYGTGFPDCDGTLSLSMWALLLACLIGTVVVLNWVADLEDEQFPPE